MNKKRIEDLINNEVLFSQEDFLLMRELLEKYIDPINTIPEYQKYVTKLCDIQEQIDNTCPKFRKLFDSYFTTSSELNNYELLLMYYLGIKKGFELKEIK